MEAALDFVGLSDFKPESAHLLFVTYAHRQEKITTDEFCKLILPQDGYAYSKVIERWANEVMAMETIDILQRLIRAQLSLVQA
jgi:hypothetical protein